MYKVWQRTPADQRLPSEKRLSLLEATAHSRWVKAVQIRDGQPVHVDCFTIGQPLSQSDGLFSRATRVDRVLIKDDPDPTPYALKDAWRQACRRPEADFYDVIHMYCEKEGVDTRGMAKCHGTLELSAFPHHTTNSTGPDDLERCHTRSLLTPVGGLITTFATTKCLVEGLAKAVYHHKIAHDAGVLHRDISEGNVLFDETTLEGFLVDWDYAEFTEKGLENFEGWFSDRYAAEKKAKAKYTTIDKSLKELTGTFAFLAIQILRDQPKHSAGHDLESFYWLLIWIILRHTTDPSRDPKACHTLFDHDTKVARVMKDDWIRGKTSLAEALPLHAVAEALRTLVIVIRQNPVIEQAATNRIPIEGLATPQAPERPIEILHMDFLRVFDFALTKFVWPTDDKAIAFDPPSVKKTAPKPQTKDDLRQTALRRSAHSQGAAGPEPRQVTGEKRKLDWSGSASSGSLAASTAGTSSAGSSESSRKKSRTIKGGMMCKGGVAPQPAPEEPKKGRGKKGKRRT
ncbi:hypothetical protein B0H17DRAFT_1055979 [Mycena rosella]|uniref:Protein kinase domain-containing protein n=1 Tax=Mycena rosella TaxID=1033263 RepID=A0AAD7GM29_MYCRO|nr:hypothetical protein B0H17DRAFT_1055979 [Mycena rosella]